LSLAIVYLFFYFKKKEISCVTIEIEKLQSESNILEDEIKETGSQKESFPSKIKRYQDLRRLIEEFISIPSLDELVETLTIQVFQLLAQNEGTCLFYLLDEARQNLALTASKRERQEDIIKAKNGDIFDWWVLKNSSNLIVLDIRKDFRFDLEKVPREEFRPIGSIISCPLILGERFLGILRLDNSSPYRFSPDDLRLLRAISDLGAIAIENAITYESTQNLAIRDSLTGLFQKSYLFGRLNEEFLRSVYEGLPLSLLMFDIDHFKDYNDSFGHIAGDLVLKSISEGLLNFFDRAGNVVARFGGEEFCVVLPRIDRLQAKEMAENFCYKIQNQEILIRRRPSKVTVSCGIATFPQDCREIKELLEVADKALYKAKELGRNRVCTI